MFRTVPLSIIRSLFTVHSAMVYVVQVCRQLSSRSRMELQFHPGPVPSWSCSKAVYKPLLSVQWINTWWTEELSETCRVSCQNKICEISASSWFYYKEICYDARPHERKKNSSNFTLLNILLCFDWTMFWLVLQHKGMAPIKKYMFICLPHCCTLR
jgi:hypothetical protein